jgi:hypothetical protein
MQLCDVQNGANGNREDDVKPTRNTRNGTHGAQPTTQATLAARLSP